MLSAWQHAATTTFGLFWMAFWAFGLGYLVSSMIQVFVSRERMRKSMGKADAKSVAVGSFFGFISSSCSFAALATTRALFAKGADIVPALAFLLASTNLVIELGIVISVFLGWQFVVGEYAGGVLLILLMWLLVHVSRPAQLIERARRRASDQEGHTHDSEIPDWKDLIKRTEGWQKVADRYVMEWRMVWKDVTIGFTVAGVIAAFVPRAFFESLFVGSDSADPGFLDILLQSLIGPVAAFFTFIGSMGNIPLAAVLHSNGVSFAGVMAFIFSDLVVLPVLRIQAQYYGWRMAAYLAAVMLAALVVTALILHYGLAALGLLPRAGAGRAITERQFFAVDYTLFLNVVFIVVSLVFAVWHWRRMGFTGNGGTLGERVLLALTVLALVWLAGGIVVVPILTA